MISKGEFHRWLEVAPFRILDGGIGTRLEDMGVDLHGRLWSAEALLNSPSTVKMVHKKYAEAGAEILKTNSYQVSYEGFQLEGYDEKDTTFALQKSVQLVQQARQETQSNALIAASLGAYGAHLANGAEYHGRYESSREEIKAFHQKKIAPLLLAGADVLAFETIPSLQEATIIAEVLQNSPPLTAWISFSCKDHNHISDGTPILTVAQWINELDLFSAVGMNCIPPEWVASAIPHWRKGTYLPIIVYPNSGELWDAQHKHWMPTPNQQLLVNQAKSWIDLGVKIIGGCCRTNESWVHRLKNLRESL